MLLDGLLQLVEGLRDRIKEHGDALRKSEMLTRYALIDPLLRELGWDTEDPKQVQPEYRSGKGSADYALLSNGKPAILIEAKKLGTPLEDGLVQGINYSLVEGTPYFVITDGQRWEIYQPHKQVPIAEKRLLAFDLLNMAPSKVALQALSLWSPGVVTGTINAAQTPIVQSEAPQPKPQVVPTGQPPILGRSQLAAMHEGEVAICPSQPDGIDFLVKYNAWGFVKLARTPKYFALYVSDPVSAIEYFAEVEKIVDPASPDSPVVTNLHEFSQYYGPGKKLVVLKRGKLWKLAEPICRGPERRSVPQGLRYILHSKLAQAITLDDF